MPRQRAIGPGVRTKMAERRTMTASELARASEAAIHLDVAVRIDTPGQPSPEAACAQVVPKLEEGAAPGGSIVAVGQLVQSRRSGRVSSTAQALTLKDFPPGQFEVLTPRTRDTGLQDTFLPVVAHRGGKLVVLNEDDEEEELSVHTINGKFARGTSVKRRLTEEWAPRVARRLHEEEEAEEDEEEEAAEDKEDGQEEDDGEEEAGHADEVHEEGEEAGEEAGEEGGASALQGRSTAYDLAERVAGVVRVKLENDAHAAESAARPQKDAYTRAREAKRDQLLREPTGKKLPRATFRRGCHAACITNVLGGQGTAVHRFSKKDVTVGTGDMKHTIIAAGEMYVSTSREWNTWAPAFAGDDCLFTFNFQHDMDEQAKALGWKEPQKVFHLFADAPATRTRGAMALPESAWHGKDAAGKGVYYGKYMLDDEELEQTVLFTQLPECTQRLEAWWTAKQKLKEKRWLNGLSGPPPAAEISKLAAQYLEQMLAATDPNDTTLPISFSWTLYGYKFVGYDEVLYKELLKVKANNGRINVDDLGPL
jgi:hypothetical protein